MAAWALRPSDVEAIRRSVRIAILGIVFSAVGAILIAVRAIMLAIIWAILIGIALFLNSALEYALTATNAPQSVRNLLEPMDWGVLVVIGLAVTLNTFRDVVNLLKIGRNDSGDDEEAAP